MSSRTTLAKLQTLRDAKRKIVSVTAYDFLFGRLADQAGVDMILVGDSLGMVVQGADTTLAVTLEEMIYHARMVNRGVERAFVVCDLPFGSYQESPEAAFRSASRLMKETGVQAVKLEGGRVMAPTARFLVERGIPVVGHVGLTPQSVHAFSGYKVQGRGEKNAEAVSADAAALIEAGVSLFILEGVPSTLADSITRASPVPTIGIGAGGGCDGQVLVLQDMLGLYDDVQPKFVKRYLQGADLVRGALHSYGDEVRRGLFPAAEHGFGES
ncbi:MAG: 3-methyl-2-oxobutanoate hydroxymethyltransferase [Magnetococcales bacterium]|nr:3-methyl-2-oxobutanoate hydroxymethyltransferase [Magnetococcales bacterium]